ncbi:hypothetical protein WJX72_002957 [[Myrmecia] bisecta]|uniref:Uncharacterized protein n=1 Tax=[Myrmecia] bisecta TaxID=41462 RepID=A0AAW1PRZ1_9CHLO
MKLTETGRLPAQAVSSRRGATSKFLTGYRFPTLGGLGGLTSGSQPALSTNRFCRLLYAGIGVLLAVIIFLLVYWVVPELHRAAHQGDVVLQFCLVQATYASTGCVLAVFQQAPYSTRCVFANPGSLQQGSDTDKSKYCSKYQVGSTHTCYYPPKEEKLVSFQAPNSFHGLYIASVLVILLLGLATSAIWWLLRHSGSDAYVHTDPEALRQLVLDMRDKVFNALKAQDASTRKELRAMAKQTQSKGQQMRKAQQQLGAASERVHTMHRSWDDDLKEHKIKEEVR